MIEEDTEAQAKKETNEKTMLMKILTSDGFHIKDAEYFSKYYILRGKQNLSDACYCQQNKDLCNFCFIGSLKGPYSHKYYSNRNKSFIGPEALEKKDVIYEDMKEGAL